MPRRNNPQNLRTGKGKGKQRATPHNGSGAQREARRTETAPHILAALQAQRERAARRVAASAGGKAEDAARSTPTPRSEEGPNERRRFPGFVFDPESKRYFKRVRTGAAHPEQAADTARCAIARHDASNPGVMMRTQSVTAPARLGTRPSRTGCRGWGLHAFVTSRRAGLVGGPTLSRFYDRSSRTTGAASGSSRRAAVEAVVCSSRFEARPVPGVSGGWEKTLSEYHDGRGIVAYGTPEGLAVLYDLRRSPSKRDSAWAGLECEDMSSERTFEGNGQLSDIRFGEFDTGFCCALAWMGRAAQPGRVNAYYEAGSEARRDAAWAGTYQSGLHSDHQIGLCDVELPRGSAWCVEWDPCSLRRLAIGTSAGTPVYMLDAEYSTLTHVAKLPSDALSISFLPHDAPGGGNVMACGLRNGVVRLLDPRVPPRDLSAGATDARYTLARLGSSVNYTRILRDGRRCLVRDRTGGLEAWDLRYPGRRPVRVLVPSCPQRLGPFLSGRFALDSSESVVATPENAAGGARLKVLGVTGGEVLSERVTPWPVLTLSRQVVGLENHMLAEPWHPVGSLSFRGLGSKETDSGLVGEAFFEAKLWMDG